MHSCTSGRHRMLMSFWCYSRTWTMRPIPNSSGWSGSTPQSVPVDGLVYPLLMSWFSQMMEMVWTLWDWCHLKSVMLIEPSHTLDTWQLLKNHAELLGCGRPWKCAVWNLDNTKCMGALLKSATRSFVSSTRTLHCILTCQEQQ